MMQLALLGGTSAVKIKDIIGQRADNISVELYPSIQSYLDTQSQRFVPYARVIIVEDAYTVLGGNAEPLLRQFVQFMSSSLPDTRVVALIKSEPVLQVFDNVLVGPLYANIKLVKTTQSLILDTAVLGIEELKTKYADYITHTQAAMIQNTTVAQPQQPAQTQPTQAQSQQPVQQNNANNGKKRGGFGGLFGKKDKNKPAGTSPATPLSNGQGAGNAPAPGFGGGNGFGNTNNANPFGQPAAPANSGFGQQNANPFGQPAAPANNGFEQQNTNPFGQPAAPANNGFEQPTAPANNGFGQQNVNPFGQPSPADNGQNANQFGQFTAPADNGFGQQNANPFGQSATPTNNLRKPPMNNGIEQGTPAQAPASSGFGSAFGPVTPVQDTSNAAADEDDFALPPQPGSAFGTSFEPTPAPTNGFDFSQPFEEQSAQNTMPSMQQTNAALFNTLTQPEPIEDIEEAPEPTTPAFGGGMSVQPAPTSGLFSGFTGASEMPSEGFQNSFDNLTPPAPQTGLTGAQGAPDAPAVHEHNITVNRSGLSSNRAHDKVAQYDFRGATQDVQIQRGPAAPQINVEEANDAGTDMSMMYGVSDAAYAQQFAPAPQVVEKVVEREVYIETGKDMPTDKLLAAGKQVIIVVTGDRRSGVTYTAISIASLYAKRVSTLLVDLDTETCGGQLYQDTECLLGEEENVQHGLLRCRNPQMLTHLVHHNNDSGYDYLYSLVGNEQVTVAQLQSLVSTLSVQRSHQLVVIDCPWKQLAAIDDLLTKAKIFICVDSDITGAHNTLELLNNVPPTSKMAQTLQLSAVYLAKQGTSAQTLQNSMEWLNDMFEVDESSGEFPWATLKIAGSANNDELLNVLKQF